MTQILRPYPFNITISVATIGEIQLIFDWLHQQYPKGKPITFVGQAMTRLVRTDFVSSMSYPHKYGKMYYRIVLSFKSKDDAMLCKLRFGHTYSPVKPFSKH